MNVVWCDPPARRGTLAERIPFDELDAYPGRWALVLEYRSRKVADNARRRLERRYGGYEWRVGVCDVGWGVWGRKAER